MVFYDEMYGLNAVKQPLDHYKAYQQWAQTYAPQAMASKRAQADAAFRQVGITFAVYGDDAGTERLIPFDLVPRIIPSNSTCRTDLFKRAIPATNARR
jgi:uncharacterized circularly permuted ATP-grasp superfamily protein